MRRGLTIAGFILAAASGVLIGLGAYTFRYAEGLSYLSPDPKACVNCHIMRPQYDGWQKASHHTVATCVDCHLPHDLVPKYLAKAENGLWHSKGFTLQDFPEPIRMRPVSQRILEHNCASCHADFVHDMLAVAPSHAAGDQQAPGHMHETLSCIHCHRTVGHGDPVGLGKFVPVSPAELEAGGPRHE